MPDLSTPNPLEISREDLYELAWSKPMSELAKDFGISDVALAKRCRRLGIPVPGRGYWARLDAGQQPHRPKLPERVVQSEDSEMLTVGPLAAPLHAPALDPDAPPDLGAMGEAFERAEREAVQADALWLRERLAFEGLAENRIDLDAPGRRWHPLIRTYRDAFEAAATAMRASKKAAEWYESWPEARKRVSSPPEGAWDWRSVRDRGQRLKHTNKPAAFRVSLETYQRAMRITNALAVEGKKRGFEMEDDAKAGRLVFAGFNARILMRVTELLEPRQRTRIGYKGQKEMEKFYLPTGRLRISFQLDYREGPTIEDEDNRAVDHSLNKVFAICYKLAIKARAEQRQDDFRDRVREVENRRRMELQRLREEEQRKADEERARRRDLLREAKRWEEARRIRGYVEHLVSKMEGCGEAFQKWTTWALSVAEDFDPSSSRLPTQSTQRNEGS